MSGNTCNVFFLSPSLPLATLDRLAVQHEIDRIGQMPAAVEG